MVRVSLPLPTIHGSLALVLRFTALTLVLFAWGCSHDSDAAAPARITLTDSLGRQVRLSQPAERIVSLAPSTTEILFAIGAEDTIVARSGLCDYPAAALELPSIGQLYPRLNAEAVVLLSPDLVLAAGVTHPQDVERLAKLGYAVYATSVSRGFDDIYRDIEAVGSLTGHTEGAASLLADLRRRVAVVEARSRQRSRRPRVFVEMDATDTSRPWTAARGSFIDALVRLAGGENVVRVTGDAYVQVSLEALIVGDPEFILVNGGARGVQLEEVRARVGWSVLTAVREGNLVAIDADLISRPGPRVVDGLEQLAAALAPPTEAGDE